MERGRPYRQTVKTHGVLLFLIFLFSFLPLTRAKYVRFVSAQPACKASTTNHARMQQFSGPIMENLKEAISWDDQHRGVGGYFFCGEESINYRKSLV